MFTYDNLWYVKKNKTFDEAVLELGTLSEMHRSSRIDQILKTFGQDDLERRLSQHAVAAQSDAMALKAARSHGLAMLRRRDEALL